MQQAHSIKLTLAIALMMPNASVVFSQGFPNKPIRMITHEAGGSPDFAARVIAQGLTGALRQQVVVDNRGGLMPGAMASKAPPDGYTLLVSSNILWILPMMQTAPYDVARDFLPITTTNMAPNVFAVHPSVPVKSVEELIVLARARPGELNFAMTTGATSHLAGELFKSMAGVNIVSIPYKGAGLAISDLISGRVQLSFFTGTSIMPHVKSGKLKALAVTSAQPSALFPDLPTVAASGLPGYESGSIYGVLAPAGTPAVRIDRLNQEVIRIINTTEVKERFFSSGSEAMVSSPKEFEAKIKSEIARMGGVIKNAGIRLP